MIEEAMVKRCHEEKVEAVPNPFFWPRLLFSHLLPQPVFTLTKIEDKDVDASWLVGCRDLVVEADVDTSGQRRIKLNLLVALGLAFCVQQTDFAFFAFSRHFLHSVICRAEHSENSRSREFS